MLGVLDPNERGAEGRAGGGGGCLFDVPHNGCLGSAGGEVRDIINTYCRLNTSSLLLLPGGWTTKRPSLLYDLVHE